MAKYGNTFYMQLTRVLWQEPYKDLSINAKWLFVTLNELEQRFTGNSEKGYFFRTDEELCKDTGLSLSTLKRAKKELKGTDLVIIRYGHFTNIENNKLSEKKVTTYTIKKKQWSTTEVLR